MAASTRQKNTRSRSRERYRDRNHVAEKWLDQYGNMSLEGDYTRNQSCLQETFNMVDIVMENTINEYIRTHIPEKERKEEYKTWYQYKDSRGKTFDFYYPTSFAARTAVLRQMGYPLPGNLDAVRKLRNETAHGNRTVVLQNRSLDYEVTRKAMVTLADVLILTGMLDPELREPSFERMRIREGDTLQKGAYTVGKLIGEGGMSRVYEGIQKHMDRMVAIKELKPGTYFRNRGLYEKDMLLLHHENIPHVYDMFFENGTYYIVMSYVSGITLENYAARYYPISLEMVISVSEAILDILSYLHSPEVRLIHGDLSPDSILIDGDGTPWLIEFGISGEIHKRQDVPAAATGYMAPELFAGGTLEERTDVYSFGCLLRYMLTGCSPNEEVVGEEEISFMEQTGFSELIRYCIASDPEGRFQSIAAVRDYFIGICENMDREEADPEKRQLRKRPARRLALTCIIAGAAAAALAVVFPGIIQTENGRDADKYTAFSANAGSGSGTFLNGNAVSVPDIIPRGSQITRRKTSVQNSANSEKEGSASVFSYSNDAKLLIITDPVERWYLALDNWQNAEKRNLLLAVSPVSHAFEFASYCCSPCILNGDISTIGLQDASGVYKTYKFLAEDGILKSCEVEQEDKSYTIIYDYESGNLVHMFSDRGEDSFLDYIAYYDDSGKLSTVACNNKLYTVGYDGRGNISEAELRSGTRYSYLYDDSEITVSVYDSSGENEKTDSQFVISENGTIAACLYQDWINTYNYDMTD